MFAAALSRRSVVVGVRGIRNYATLSYRDIVDISSSSKSSEKSSVSGEHLSGPAGRLFKQLSSYDDSLEMFGYCIVVILS